MTLSLPRRLLLGARRHRPAVAGTSPSSNAAFPRSRARLLGGWRSRRLDSQLRPASFWRAVKLLPREGNGPEQTVLLHLLTPDAEVHEIHPHLLNLSCPVVQSPGRKWWAIVQRAAGLLVAILPQVKIEARYDRHPQLDFLAAVRRGGRCALVDVEVDGPYHNPTLDRKRPQGRDRSRALLAEGCPAFRFPGALLDRLRELVD